MTIRQCISRYGWNNCADLTTAYRSMDVTITFIQDETSDETQFQISAYNVKELEELYSDFCKENKLPKNTVTSVTIAQVYEKCTGK